MEHYSERKSKKPILITAVLTATAIFVLYHLFIKGPNLKVDRIRKVCGRSRSVSTQAPKCRTGSGRAQRQLARHWYS